MKIILIKLVAIKFPLVAYLQAILIISLLSISCSQSMSSNKNIYFLEHINSEFFVKYNLFIFRNIDFQVYYVISEKVDTIIDLGLNSFYQKLMPNKSYFLSLKKIDSLLVGETKFYPTRKIDIFFNNSEVIWEQDTFRVKLFKSNEIKNLYLKNND